MYRFSFLAILFLLYCIRAEAQVPASNLKQGYVKVSADTLQFDSLSIIPGTFSVTGIADSNYVLDYPRALLFWKHLPPFDSVYVRYRTFPLGLTAVSQNLKFDSIMDFFLGKPYVPEYGRESDRFFNFGDINYNGSFGRGISFGNAQDAVVTSNLNLQLSGYLADSIEILAAITDNNIPIQPDGTTQQLNEFDRIYLQFRKNNWQLALGDIDIRQNQSYFLSFYKRLQGIAFENTSHISDNVTNHTLVSGSVAKGKFTRNVFQGQEGNQGPYRLRGANNEFFFIILANTERVYLDGELLQRGEDQDYVINYNTAEISFTPRRMITKDSRIQVEFEYSDRNYLNANLYLTNATTVNDRLTLRVSAFSNNDSKNSPINQTLDNDQKDFLMGLGNNTDQAFYPHAIIDSLRQGEILYARKDTAYDGIMDTIYYYSTHPDSAVYQLTFIEVGQGRGNYVQDLNGVNGKVFKWVQPVGGVPQGRFEPAMFLVTPKKHQVFSIGADYKISKSTTLITEGALSNYDPNTFSAINDDLNKGYAGRVLLKNEAALKNSGRLQTSAGFEFTEKRFRPLERIRQVEFTRDWGLQLVEEAEDEKLLTGEIQYDNTGLNLHYQFASYQRGSNFYGFRNVITHRQNLSGLKLDNQVSLTNFKSSSDKGYFIKPSFRASKIFENIRNYELWVAYRMEHNEVRNNISDSLAAYAFSFNIAEAGIQSDLKKPNKWGIKYYSRTDDYPVGKELLRSDRSSNINAFTELSASSRHQFRVNATYRNLRIFNTAVSNLKPEQTLLGRAEYRVNEMKGFLTGQLLYEVGSGQEQKRDYTYLEVPVGQGEYTWIDYDNNGIQSLNEFEIAAFPDQAKYIRIFTPTNEFIRANYNTFNYSIGLNPSVFGAPGKGLKGLLSRFHMNSSLQVNKKEQASGLVQLNPFSGSLHDTSLITLTSVFANVISFNRLSSKWGVDFNTLENDNKSLLTYGYETRKIVQRGLKFRYNISRTLLAEFNLKNGSNLLSSSHANFDNRNYSIESYSISPGITYTKGTSFRIYTAYEYSSRENRIGFEENVSMNSLKAEIKYNVLQNTSLQSGFSFSDIRFESKGSGPVLNTTSSYIILDGLSPGKNFLWNIDLTRRLSDFLELNIRYEGRKPGENRMIHTGRAALRALL